MNKKLFSIVLLSIILLSGIGVIPVLAQSVSPASDFEYDLNGDGTGVVILKYIGKGGDIVIPDSIEDFPVVSVGCGFDNENVKTPITSVIFPDTITYIDTSFADTVKKIFFPRYCSYLMCFLGNCNALEAIRWPNTQTTIPFMCFAGINVSSVALWEGLETIESGAFTKSKIETLEIPNSVKSIGSGAFKGCENLTTVTMPSHKIRYDDDSVFEGCKKLSLKAKKMIRDTGYTGGF